MREVTITIPDDLKMITAYYKFTDGTIRQVDIYSSGLVADDMLADSKKSMDMRYVEGLEKRIDLLEMAMPSGGKNVDVALEALFSRVGRLEERFDKSEKRIEAHAKSIASTDADINEWCDDTDKLEKRMDRIENRLAKLEKPCVDMETIVGAIGAPKLKPIPEPLVNRGSYTDILRRLKELEERAKVSRPTWDNFSLHDQRICALEERAKTSRPGWSNYNVLLHRIEELEKLPKQVDALTEEVKISPSTYSSLKLVDNRLEDVEKKAAIAESVRKQLAEDIKGLQGRISRIFGEE